MANVSFPHCESSETRRERAQLLIVIGLVVAIALVSLALFLNTTIYVDNVGSRGADVGGGDAASFVTTVEDGGETLLKAANENETGHEDQYDALNENVTEWNNQSQLYYTSRGIYTDVTLNGSVEGTRIGQDSDGIRQDGDDNFTSASGDDDWTLANDVHAREFELAVKAGELNESRADAFRLRIFGDEEKRNVTIYTDDSNVMIADHENNTETVNGEAKIDFANETVNDAESPVAEVFRGLNNYTIAFENADQVTGAYRLLVDDPPGAVGDAPNATPVLYSVELDVVYERAPIEYDSTITVAPGEIHD